VSVWCVCPCVSNSYLEILPSGTFFPEKNNPRRTTSHNLQNGQFCCHTRAPPSASFGNISTKIKLQNRRSNPTGRQDSTHIAVVRHRLSPLFASAQASLLLASVFFYRTIIITEVDDDGMIALLHNHPDSGRRCRGSGRGIGGVGRHSDREEWPQFDRHS
jgi:hypothetical protein